MGSAMTDYPKGPEESRMVTASLKCTPELKHYIECRAKQERISVSEYLHSLVRSDRLRQGGQGRPADDPALAAVRELAMEAYEAARDGILDQLEGARVSRKAVKAADRILNADAVA